MKRILSFIIIPLLFFKNSFALIEVDITRGNLDPLPIAVSPLHVDVKSENLNDVKIKKLGENISELIEKNFKSTGLFNPLKKEAFVQKPDIAHLKPDEDYVKTPSFGNRKILERRKIAERTLGPTAAQEMTAQLQHRQTEKSGHNF